MGRGKVVLLALVFTGCSGGKNDPDPKRPISQIQGIQDPVYRFVPLTLDGGISYAQTGEQLPPFGIAEFQWTLAGSPVGSAATVVSSGSTAVIVPDVLGFYSGSLTVVDEAGLVSDPANFEFTAVTAEGEASELFVALLWDTPDTDLDLHVLLVSSGGTLFSTPYDCYYGNPNPHWGAVDDENDPRLTIDDVTGFGPEGIEFVTPQSGAIYGVHVHYRTDDKVGATMATIRSTRVGELIAPEESQLLVEDEIWDVGTISYSTTSDVPSFTLVDTVGPNPF